jgi:hypothetical protein
MRRKVDHGGQIVIWYWQQATNLAKVIVSSAARVLMWVRGRADKKAFPNFLINHMHKIRNPKRFGLFGRFWMLDNFQSFKSLIPISSAHAKGEKTSKFIECISIVKLIFKI